MRINGNPVDKLTVQVDALGTTTEVGATLRNLTAAAAGAQQYSPGFSLIGQGWKTDATAASQEVETRWELRPVQGAAAPTYNYVLMGRVNAGAWSDIFTLTSAGDVGIGTTPEARLDIKSSAVSSAVQYWKAADGSNLGLVYETAAGDVLFRLFNAAGTTKNEISSNGTSYFNAGNVGIGIAAAPEKLSQGTDNGATWGYGQASELLTLSTSGTTTDTAANLLPANSIIESVVARVTTTITTATSWQLGDATTAGRFTAANSTMTAGTTDVGLVHVDVSGAGGPRQTAAAKVRVTTVGTPGAGVIRLTVFYRALVPPTS